MQEGGAIIFRLSSMMRIRQVIAETIVVVVVSFLATNATCFVPLTQLGPKRFAGPVRRFELSSTDEWLSFTHNHGIVETRMTNASRQRSKQQQQQHHHRPIHLLGSYNSKYSVLSVTALSSSSSSSEEQQPPVSGGDGDGGASSSHKTEFPPIQ